VERTGADGAGRYRQLSPKTESSVAGQARSAAVSHAELDTFLALQAARRHNYAGVGDVRSIRFREQDYARFPMLIGPQANASEARAIIETDFSVCIPREHKSSNRHDMEKAAQLAASPDFYRVKS
jgi:hypothetical protein